MALSSITDPNLAAPIRRGNPQTKKYPAPIQLFINRPLGPSYGARPLKRAVQRYPQDSLLRSDMVDEGNGKLG